MLENSFVLGFLIVASILWFFGIYKGGLDSFFWNNRSMSIFWFPFSRMPEEVAKKRYVTFNKIVAHIGMFLIVIGFLIGLINK